MLGTAMVLVGNADLANLNKEATSPKNIGMWAWRLVIGAGIIVVVMGVVNLFAVRPIPLLSFIAPSNKFPPELHIPRHTHQPNRPPSPLPRRRRITQSRRRVERQRRKANLSPPHLLPRPPRHPALVLLALHDLKVRSHLLATHEAEHLEPD
jgi:hypothetical protein